MKEELIQQLQKVKASSIDLTFLDDKLRNSILYSLAQKLRDSVQLILSENSKDLIKMTKEDPLYDRLLLTEQRIYSMAQDIENVATLDSPLGKKLEKRTIDNGLLIEKIVVPLGVIAVIYESRPNVTIDVFTLCFKTANACVLKGGKEAYYSNKVLINVIKEVLVSYSIDPNIVLLLPTEREATHIILQAHNLIDVCIPRGSQALIQFVRENAKIPVIETGAGIVHTYFDKTGNVEKASKIIENAKTRRVSVCNALDTLIIHREALNQLYQLVKPLLSHKVEIFADQASYQVLSGKYDNNLLFIAKDEDFGKEFLSYKISIKTVSSVDEAIEYIRHYTSYHSEAIIAEDPEIIQYFIDKIDVAAVYVNTSTAFTDGAQFGLGAEIGISTQKLHARGPMGLDALTSYKWVITGNGQIRS